MSKQEALVRALIRDATAGHSAAFSRFLRLCQRAGILQDHTPTVAGGVLHFPMSAFQTSTIHSYQPQGEGAKPP
jgi:hypothetical protein